MKEPLKNVNNYLRGAEDGDSSATYICIAYDLIS